MVAQPRRGVASFTRSGAPRLGREPPEQSGARAVGPMGGGSAEEIAMRAVIFSVFAAARLLAVAPVARTEGKAYCDAGPAGTKSCDHDSLERCQRLARANGGGCVMNPAHFGTAGGGGLDAPRGSGAHSLDR